MSKVLLIVNPSSGGEKAKSYEDLAREKLAECFDEVVVKHTEKGGDAAAFAKQAAEDHYDSVLSWVAMELSMKESVVWLN